MPHVTLEGVVDSRLVAERLPRSVYRWGRAVLKTEDCWLRGDAGAVLAEGVVVEHSRPLHPVAIIAARSGTTTVRLWPTVPVERTLPVQRWLAMLAVELIGLGLGGLRSTNLAVEVVADLPSLSDPGPAPTLMEPGSR